VAPHSLEEANQNPDALAQANRELSDMIFTGRSFSGRERHCAFLNVGSGGGGAPQFARISAVSGLDLPDDGRAVAVSDWDLDGDLDLWISNRNAPRIRFFRNDLTSDNHFIAIRLEGDGEKVNRDAIGARVEIHFDEPGHQAMIKTLRAGEGFLAQSSKWLHFGLGESQKIDRLVVRWPAGETVEFFDLDADSRYKIVAGSAEAELWSPPERTLEIVESPPAPADSSGAARIPLAYRLPMIRVPYQQFDGSTQWARFNKRKPVLLNVWASWCSPCIGELQEFTDRSDDIRAAGIEVLALSVDGLKDGSTAEAAERTIARIKFPFAVGRATPQLLNGMEIMHHRQIPMRRPLPLPTSFLVDADGQLAAIYKGPVSVDVLLDDVKHLGGDGRERFVNAAAFSGRTIDHPKIDLARRRTETLIRFRLATSFEEAGRFDEAALHYQGVVEMSPDYAEAHNNLGNALDRLGEFAPAEEHLRTAIRLKPDFAFAHHNLGNALLHQQSVHSALAAYRKAIELDPEEAGFYLSFGIALVAADQPADQAIAAFEMAAELAPQMEAAQFLLGIMQERIGEPQNAITYYERTLELNPNHADARQHLARIKAGGN